MDLGVVILAAGQGTRMRSTLPKVLHPLAGLPLLGHVLETAARLNPKIIVVVYGHGGPRVPEYFSTAPVQWAEQLQQLGTGHAVLQALPLIQEVDRVLVLYGDVPLIESNTLQRLLDESADISLGMITALLDDPTGYGRVVRDPIGRILRIVEQKDATEAELEIDEVNTGIMVFDQVRVGDWLGCIENSNVQREYYLTDVIALAVADGVEVASVQPQCLEEVLGVNDRLQLAHLERHLQGRQAQALMRAGVTLLDPARFDLRGTLHAGRDVSIDVNVIIEGDVVLGDGVSIGPNCLLSNCRLGPGTRVYANSVIEGALVGSDVHIGPFARIRPGTELDDRARIGNFVEIKKSHVGLGSKVNHLTYLGDSEIGSSTNVGAGTITCNYDGARKHRTVIGKNAFIGSNTALVAPVRVGDGATIGAGSVITRDAPSDRLTVTRAGQTTIEGWRRPKKDIVSD
jgi:bifunctional UDP-N-acetylglucosamine pyrophosphorylase/glucosamine-1-phosphate N-acetyltransferase